MAFNWDDHPIVEENPAPGPAPSEKSFNWDDHPVVDKPSIFKSAVREGVQGITGGFSDELSGGLEAAGRVVGVKGAGGGFDDLSIDSPTLDPDILKEAYIKQRDRYRDAMKQDEKENPITSTAANIAGAVVSPINKIAKGAGIVKQGAILGGIGGAGISEGDSALEVGWDAAKGAAGGAILGKGVDKIAKGATKAASTIASIIEPPRAKKDIELIKAAADRLGIKVTPAMLDDTGFVERLESTLAKSPSVVGRMVNRNARRVLDKMDEAGQSLTKDASGLSPYQTGEKFKSDLTAKVAQRLDPLSATFDDVANSTKHIPLTESSVKAVKRNIENLQGFRISGGGGKPQHYVDMLSRLKNADDVKQAMTLLNADIKAADGAEKRVLIEIKEKFSNLEKNSIMRAAIGQAKEAGQKSGSQIGSSIVRDLKDARKGYRQLSEDVNSLAADSRVRSKAGPNAFLDEVEKVPSERIGDKFFNVGNNRQIQNLSEKFPEQFELLRSGKIKEIADSAVNNRGNFEAARFLKEVKKLSPEAKQTLFKGQTSVIDDLETIQQTLPRNFNPSGTASEIGWQDAIYKNVKDIPTYLLYKGASSNLSKDITEQLLKLPKFRTVYEKNPAAFQNMVNQIEQGTGLIPQGTSPLRLPRAADEPDDEAKSVPTKGPDKWVNDGSEKLKSHGLKDQTLIDNAMKSQKGRELLIQASDLKPGTKAMDRIFSQLKTDFKGGA